MARGEALFSLKDIVFKTQVIKNSSSFLSSPLTLTNRKRFVTPHALLVSCWEIEWNLYSPNNRISIAKLFYKYICCSSNLAVILQNAAKYENTLKVGILGCQYWQLLGILLYNLYMTKSYINSRNINYDVIYIIQ